MPRITNRTGKEVSEQWMEELKEALNTTIKLLDDLDNLGYLHKKVIEVELVERDCPVWIGISGTEGRIEINPQQHDARAVAHEAGHGFHEKLRERGKRNIYGEDTAEAIRWFVEQIMGPAVWCNGLNKYPCDGTIIKICNGEYSTFTHMLKTGELFRRLNWD